MELASFRKMRDFAAPQLDIRTERCGNFQSPPAHPATGYNPLVRENRQMAKDRSPKKETKKPKKKKV
jgi:hypothetical protein